MIGASHELGTMGQAPRHNEVLSSNKAERDARVLARLGKKSVLEVWVPVAN